ncbi:MAG: substrate-binding domain-containing protein [Armatimonadetes bacterium]|nr:substrate-binding domain-containing protein [Armatimonadota bacterium]MCA1997026.1 substrate-binding domain-containing protein [Armatimonadota bacterium]
MAQGLWERIMLHYRERIERGDLRPGDRLPSDARLATEWGVSRPTAHRALAELRRQGLVVRTKGSGTVVADRANVRTGRVALIVDRMDPRYNFPHTDLLRGIQDALGEDTGLVVARSDDDPRREARLLDRFSLDADGILAYPVASPKNNDAFHRAIDRGTPVVALDRRPEGLRADLVATDNADATRRVVELLLAEGHRRIAFFSFHKPTFSSVVERHTAYVRALREVGCGDPEPWVRWFPQSLENEPNLLIQAARDALVALTRPSEGVTALFCVEDYIALAALEAAEGAGLRVPDDLRLAFFNDWPQLMFRDPWRHHRVVQDVYGIGRRATERLQLRMGGERCEPVTVSVPALLHPATESGPASALAAVALTPHYQTNGG